MTNHLVHIFLDGKNYRYLIACLQAGNVYTSISAKTFSSHSEAIQEARVHLVINLVQWSALAMMLIDLSNDRVIAQSEPSVEATGGAIVGVDFRSIVFCKPLWDKHQIKLSQDGSASLLLTYRRKDGFPACCHLKEVAFEFDGRWLGLCIGGIVEPDQADFPLQILQSIALIKSPTFPA